MSVTPPPVKLKVKVPLILSNKSKIISLFKLDVNLKQVKKAIALKRIQRVAIADDNISSRVSPALIASNNLNCGVKDTA